MRITSNSLRPYVISHQIRSSTSFTGSMTQMEMKSWVIVTSTCYSRSPTNPFSRICWWFWRATSKPMPPRWILRLNSICKIMKSHIMWCIHPKSRKLRDSWGGIVLFLFSNYPKLILMISSYPWKRKGIRFNYMHNFLDKSNRKFI